MKRILIDLDILTNALWKGTLNAPAVQFLERVKTGEFVVYTPYVLLDLVNKWKNKNVADRISEFYKLYSTEIITVEKLAKKLQETDADYEMLSKELTKITNKEDDSDLVLISSLFALDYLVTFNRKHLQSKREQISAFLKGKGLDLIIVVLPNEI